MIVVDIEHASSARYNLLSSLGFDRACLIGLLFGFDSSGGVLPYGLAGGAV